MAKHGSLGEFDHAKGDWKSYMYIKRAKQYFLANDITDEDKQQAILLSCCGDATYRTIKDVMSPQAPGEATFTVIAEKMTTCFQPAPSEIVQCFRFNTQVCRPHETVAAYISQLKQLVEHCNFGNEARLNKMIRDRLVCGIANEKWQQCLLAEDDLSYDKATKLLLSFEAAEEMKDLVRDKSEKPEVHQVHMRQPPKKSSQGTRKSNHVTAVEVRITRRNAASDKQSAVTATREVT